MYKLINHLNIISPDPFFAFVKTVLLEVMTIKYLSNIAELPQDLIFLQTELSISGMPYLNM